jgi:hypothetical protein
VGGDLLAAAENELAPNDTLSIGHTSDGLYLYVDTWQSDYTCVMPDAVPAYLSGSAAELGGEARGATNPGGNTTFGFVPSTNAMAAHGLPNEKAATLSNLALNNGPDDGVSQTATSPPTSVLVTLAAAGRNPTDILISTQAGTDGSGDDDDVAGGGGSATSGGAFQAMDDPPTSGSNLISGSQQVTIERIKPPSDYIPEELRPMLAQAEADNRRYDIIDLFDPPKPRKKAETELQRVNRIIQRAMNEPARVYNSSPSAAPKSYDQRLLNWYGALLAEMAAVGNALQRGGVQALQKRPGYEGLYPNIRNSKTRVALETGPPTSPVVFPELWPELSEAIKYSVNNYISARFDPIFKGFTIFPGLPQNGYNLRDFFLGYFGPPITLLDAQTFHDKDGGLYTALHTLIHEPNHDFVYDHKGMRNLLPTLEPPDAGPGEDAFTRFWNFLHQAVDENGNSLFSRILQMAGPPPTP